MTFIITAIISSNFDVLKTVPWSLRRNQLLPSEEDTQKKPLEFGSVSLLNKNFDLYEAYSNIGNRTMFLQISLYNKTVSGLNVQNIWEKNA